MNTKLFYDLGFAQKMVVINEMCKKANLIYIPKKVTGGDENQTDYLVFRKMQPRNVFVAKAKGVRKLFHIVKKAGNDQS